MKKIIMVLFLFSGCIFTTNAIASSGNIDFKKEALFMTEEQKDQRLAEIKNRVEEIKSIDKSQLTKEDRVALKDELKQMHKEVRADTHGRIYISLGAVIIIILLLIIIL